MLQLAVWKKFGGNKSAKKNMRRKYQNIYNTQNNRQEKKARAKNDVADDGISERGTLEGQKTRQEDR